MTFGYILFAIMIVIQPIAQLLEKHGIGQIGLIEGFSSLFSFHTIGRIITNPFIVSGAILSAIGLLFWLAVLSHFKLNYIYPFGAISYIVLLALAYFFLGETITAVRAIGVVVIVAGCILINL